MAYSIIGIDEQHVCEPLIYLVTKKHELHTGNFVESNPVYSTTMTVRPQIHSNHEITFESIKTRIMSQVQADVFCANSDKQCEEFFLELEFCDSLGS